jgi:uncharacterized protein with PQ loop repeat
MSMIEIIGGSGLYLVEASYLPQLFRLHKLKEADEFSFLFPALNIVGRLAGVMLSIHDNKPTFTLFFIVGIVLRSALLSQVIYYRTRKKRLAISEIAGDKAATVQGARI